MRGWILAHYMNTLDAIVSHVESMATVEEAIECLAFHDEIRKRLDRIQADPKRRPSMSFTQSDMEGSAVRPEREGREGDTQPMPKAVEGPVMHQVVIDALNERLSVGIKRYGQPLRAFNGRNPAQDAFEEILDLSVYHAQMVVEFERMQELLRQVVQYSSQGFTIPGDLVKEIREVLL